MVKVILSSVASNNDIMSISNISAYASYLYSEDSNSEEILAMETEIKSLIKRKFELECQLYVPRPRKFKDFDGGPHTPTTYGDVEEWDIPNLEANVHFNKLCGIFVTEVEEGIKVHFKTGPGCEEYAVCLKRVTDTWTVEKHHLPPLVPIMQLSEDLLKVKKQLCKFCRRIYHFISVFEDRKWQIQAVKNSISGEDIQLFASHGTEYVKIEFNTHEAGAIEHKISVHLQYRPNCIFPQKINLDFNGVSDELKAALAERCNIFKSLPLLDAIKIALLKNEN